MMISFSGHGGVVLIGKAGEWADQKTGRRRIGVLIALLPGRRAVRRRASANAPAAAGSRLPEVKIRMPAQRAPPGPPPSAPICPAGTDVCTQADGSAKRPPTLTGIQARPPERALTRGGCRLGRPAARDSTMPPMTGPGHYYRAEQLLAEASEIIRFRQQPGQSGPADLPVRPTDMDERRRLSSDPGLSDRTIAEAQVHATLALAAATAVAGLGPDSRAWADVAGTKLSSG
jgi:hypothetical protein